MDTSETYQKMCDKAEEIQRQRPYGRAWQEGRWLIHPRLKRWGFLSQRL